MDMPMCIASRAPRRLAVHAWRSRSGYDTEPERDGQSIGTDKTLHHGGHGDTEVKPFGLNLRVHRVPRGGEFEVHEMKNLFHVIVVMIAAGTIVGFAQEGRVRPLPAQIPSISQRPTGSSLGTIRAGAADDKIWFGWRVGVPAATLKPLTFSEALPKYDLASVPSVEASSTQIVSPEIPKKLDYRLQPGERNAVVYRLRELNEQILAYRVDSLGSDAATRRK